MNIHSVILYILFIISSIHTLEGALLNSNGVRNQVNTKINGLKQRILTLCKYNNEDYYQYTLENNFTTEKLKIEAYTLSPLCLFNFETIEKNLGQTIISILQDNSIDQQCSHYQMLLNIENILILNNSFDLSGLDDYKSKFSQSMITLSSTLPHSDLTVEDLRYSNQQLVGYITNFLYLLRQWNDLKIEEQKQVDILMNKLTSCQNKDTSVIIAWLKDNHFIYRKYSWH